MSTIRHFGHLTWHTVTVCHVRCHDLELHWGISRDLADFGGKYGYTDEDRPILSETEL